MVAWIKAVDASDEEFDALPDVFTVKALFVYMRAIASAAADRFAVSSPLHSLQVLLGKQRVPYKGELLHRPQGQAQFILVPCALLTDAEIADFDLNISQAKWVSRAPPHSHLSKHEFKVICIHSCTANHAIIMDPCKNLSSAEVPLAKSVLEKIIRSAKRQLHLPNSTPSLSVAKSDSYLHFADAPDSAFGVSAIAERFMTGSSAALKRGDFELVTACIARPINIKSLRLHTSVGCTTSSSKSRPAVTSRFRL